MKKNILFFVLLSAVFNLNAQQNKDSLKIKSEFSKKIHFGGGFQLSLGNSYTAIGLSPSAIYEINEKWKGGMSLSYLYVNDKLYNYHSNVYGSSALVLYNPLKELQLHTELEILYVDQNNRLEDNQYWVPAFSIGAGYAIGKHGAIGLRYDLLWDEEKSIYRDALTPFVKIYF